MSKFNIGDKVWATRAEYVEKRIICPDCMGKRALTVIMGDDSVVSIDCAGCAGGYEPPRGYITCSEWRAGAIQVEINHIEIGKNGVEYGYDGGYRKKESEIFFTEKEAVVCSAVIAEEHNAEELERIGHKERPTRTWAWNAHYHRDCIRRAKKDLEYHTAKLNVAKAKSKESTNDPN